MGEKKTKRWGRNQNLDEPHREIDSQGEGRGETDQNQTKPNPSSPHHPWRRRYEPPPPSARGTDWAEGAMAARSDDPDVSPAAGGGEIWGTLEDLLLACAVSRHGTASWDSVAMEVHSRIPSAAAWLTPTSCRQRFRLLHRRFTAGADENCDGGGGDEEPDAAAVDWLVEELRKERVAELHREVQRRDLSIGSLQSKVKRLKEERDRSLSGEAKPAAKDEHEAGEGSPEEANGENRVSGEESGRSCKESNSSDLKRPGHDSAAAGDDGDAAVKEEPAVGEVEVKEEASGESVAGSKEADAEKESSDVQSSASPSRRRRRLRKVAGDEVDAEAASTSASVLLPAAETEPLLALLESVRSSKFGSLFERRLESQEGGRYRATIRCHVDLEMIRSKLEPGATTRQGGASCYASASEFYRDLLLLCANALIFFPRGSPEHAAATKARALVSASLRGKDGLGTAGKAAAAAVGGSSADGTRKPKTDAETAGSLLEKATPIIVCRKRSSIAKAAAAAAKEEKVEKAETEEEEDDNVDKKKGGTKEKARGLRSNKSRGTARNAAPNQRARKASESAELAEGTKKSDKKGGGGGGSKAAAGGVVKKRNAVDFLNRMKQNSVPSTERVSLLETLKLSAATEQKKSGKGDNRKEPSGSGSKKAAAADTPPAGRRSVGRPPKRAAAPPSPPPSKRAKDDRPTRKRGRK